MDLNKLYHVINEAEESPRYIAKKGDEKYFYVFDTENQKYLQKMFDIASLGEEEAERLAQIEADKLNKNPDLLEGPDLMDDEQDIDDMIQCVIKIKDIGNDYEYQGMIEDNTDYLSQYDVDVEFQDRLDGEDPTIQFVLAYHREGEEEFYDESGVKFDLDMEEHQKFKDDANKPLENPTVPNSIEDIA